MIKRIALGSDHGGLALKNELVTFLMTQPGVSVDDKGTYTEDSVDYPDFADKVVNSIKNNENDLGILCSSIRPTIQIFILSLFNTFIGFL